jgi:hypothetical protein
VKRMLRQHLSSTWTSFHESVMQSKANQTLHKVLNKVPTARRLFQGSQHKHLAAGEGG